LLGYGSAGMARYRRDMVGDGGLLVDILVDRAGEAQRSMMQIVLNESLTVAPKLTTDQFDALSLIFLLKYTRHTNIRNPGALGEYIEAFWIPFLEVASREHVRFQHLEYAGCGNIGLAGSQIEQIVAQHYPWVVCKGFTWEEAVQVVDSSVPLAKLLVPCFHDQSRWQLTPLYQEEFESLASEIEVEKTHVDQLWKLQSDQRLGTEDLRAFLVDRHPQIEDLINFWKETSASNMTLTSVGIAIGHANIRRKLDTSFDLGIWIK